MPTAPLGSTLPLLVLAALTGSDASTQEGPSAVPETGHEALAVRIALEEYRFSPEGPGRWLATNRQQGLRGRIDATGLSVEPREKGDGPYHLRLATRSIGLAGSLPAAGPAVVALHGERLELRRPGSIEWFENGPEGLEQGWTITAPPAGPAGTPLRIELELSGLEARVLPGGDSLELLDAGGELRLRYHGLRAWDASGSGLDARLLEGPCGPIVEVELEGAQFPVEVDPVLSGPAWLLGGGQAGAGFGFDVTGAGDVNGDGYADLVVGAPDFDGGQPDEGAALLFLGCPGGLAFTPAWSFEPDQAGANLGTSVAGVGDLNGDGYGDFVVGAPRYDAGQTDEGRVFVFLGSPIGPSRVPDWTAESDQVGALFGNAVAGAGDVDGDGFGDLVVGAREYDAAASGEGGAFLFRGSPAGLVGGPAWSATSGQSNARFGWSVAGAGDVNADGYDDLLVGALDYDDGQTGEGAAFLYLGSAAGPATTPSWTAEGDQTFALFGIAVDGAGDVNGDGYDDVLIGARWYDGDVNNEGAAFVYLGGAAGPSATPDWTATGGQTFASFGESVAGAGDVDADGFDDVAVGALFHDEDLPDEGTVFVYRGSPLGPSAEPDWQASGNQPSARYGRSVAGTGDIDGNGIEDLAAGGDGLDFDHQDEGGAVLYLGRASRLSIYCTCEGAGTPAPCGNAGEPYRGCANSAGGGCLLWATGPPSTLRDTMVLSATGAPPGATGIFMQGTGHPNGGDGFPFGDGLRCIGGTTTRIEVVQADASGALHTSVPLVATGGAQPGDVRRYQLWFDDPGASPCGAGFNTSNGLEVRWGL